MLNALIIVFFALYVGRKLGIDDKCAILIGVGTSICGASATAAIGPANKAKEEEMGLAIACITLFGLVAMFVYPYLYANTVVGQWLQLNLNTYARWVG